MKESLVAVACTLLQSAIGTVRGERNCVFFIPDHGGNPFEKCGVFLRNLEWSLAPSIGTDGLHQNEYISPTIAGRFFLPIPRGESSNQNCPLSPILL